MKKIKIAFIQKEWEDNLGILWINALLKEHGFSVIVEVENASTYKRMRAFSPDIVGYSCLTGRQKWIFSSIANLRRSGIDSKIIVGGPHATFFPDLIDNPLIDGICRGEGELAMLEYAQALEEGKEPYGIKNFCFNVNGTILRNDLRPLIADLDSLPLPDRSYYNTYAFLASNPYKIFITSRGCPFECTFCFNHALGNLYGNSAMHIRRRSVENVIKELRQVYGRWGFGEVRFSDDHFTFDTQWLADFTREYGREVKRPYTINARADTLDEAKIAMLKNSGCRLICFGIETGNETRRNEVLKKGITDEQIIRVAALLKKHRIAFLTSNIIGLPFETSEEAWKTVELNQKIGTDLPWFSLMQYYPGTQIYTYAKEHSLLSPAYNPDDAGGYFKQSGLSQNNIDELKNIHSFSILASRWPGITSLCKYLVKGFKPNPVFRLVFKISYLCLTLQRTRIGMGHILRWWRYYLVSIRN